MKKRALCPLSGVHLTIKPKLTSVNVPSHYLPFAVDWGGNYFAIDLQSGNIVLLFMDLGEFTEDCVEYLAESYSEFVENLVKAED